MLSDSSFFEGFAVRLTSNTSLFMIKKYASEQILALVAVGYGQSAINSGVDRGPNHALIP